VRRTAALWAAIAVVVLAGGAQSAVGLTAPAYTAKADRVCTVANARLAALPSPRTADEIRAWVTRAVPIVAASTKRLRALAPPARLRARHRVWSRALTRRASAAQALSRRIAAGAPPVAALADALPTLTRLKRAARARARALGLHACAGRPRG
jgi:hypothetical protein